MDDRTYPNELARLRAEVERLTHDLADTQTIANLQRDLHAAELATANENAAELGKALDMALAERDQAYRDLDAQTLKANSFRRELHRYMQHAIELKDMLDASVAERDSAFAELDAHRRELTALRDERPRLLAANVRLFHDNTALRAELDAERNAHNATAAQLYAELAGAQDTATSAAQAWRTVTDERDALRAELDTQAKRHAEIIDQWKAEENMWRYYDKKQLAQIDALRAELDAMRQAHSVIAARMEAMGC